MHTTRHAVAAVVVAVPLTLPGTLASAADSTLGSTDGSPSFCQARTYLQTATDGAQVYAVPSNGVITSVTMVGTNGVARAFKLGRLIGSTWTIVGTTPTGTVQGGSLVQQTRIPARAGDVIGTYVGTDSNCEVTTQIVNDRFSTAPGNAGVGTTASSPSSSIARLLVSAKLEPDVDGDGYGDSTQDKCLGSTAFNPCFTAALGKPSGKAKVGKTLTAPPVALPAPGVTASYQWLRVTKKKHKTVLKAIGGATSSTYKVKRKDRGKKLEVQVTLSSPGFASAVGYSGPKKAH